MHIVDQEFLIHRPTRRGAVQLARPGTPVVHVEPGHLLAQNFRGIEHLGKEPGISRPGLEAEPDAARVNTLEEHVEWLVGQDRLRYLFLTLQLERRMAVQTMPLFSGKVLYAGRPHAPALAVLVHD